MAHPDLPALLSLVSQAESKALRSIVVDSPPGAGKTLLIEQAAAELTRRGSAVAVAAPGNEQSLEFVRRFRISHPEIAVQLWLAQDRRLPSDLSQGAQRGNRGSYWLGPTGAHSIHVGTISKLGTIQFPVSPLNICIVDEAYQVTFSGYEPLLAQARHHVFVGDPGQLAPTVRIDTTSFENLRFRPYLPVPLEMARLEPEVPQLKLGQTHRFPSDSAALLRAFYPQLPFTSALSPSARRVQFRKPAILDDAIDQALDSVASGASLVALTLSPAAHPLVPYDSELLHLVAEVGARLIQREAVLPDGAVVGMRNVGYIEPHVAAGEIIRRELSVKLGRVNAVVNTPEVWQGLQRPFTVTRHPVGNAPSDFDLDPGRFCVALSRHQYGCIVVARADVEDVLHGYRTDAGQRALGAPDRVWHGRCAHTTFWSKLRDQDRVFAIS